jgi:anti-sigma B factor antagonist
MALQEATSTTPRGVEVEFPQSSIAVLKLRGEHDLSSKQHLSEALAEASARSNVLIDLSECTFMDSSVIATFVVAHKRLSGRGGRLGLVIPPEATTIQRIAEITSLVDLLPVHETQTAAVEGLRTNQHSIRIRDLRLRFGDPHSYMAECACGWSGETYTLHQTARRDAKREGAIHIDEQRRP